MYTGSTDMDMYKGTTTCTCTLDQHKDCSRQIITMFKVCHSFPQQPRERAGGVRKGGGREGDRKREGSEEEEEKRGGEWEVGRGV